MRLKHKPRMVQKHMNDGVGNIGIDQNGKVKQTITLQDAIQ